MVSDGDRSTISEGTTFFDAAEVVPTSTLDQYGAAFDGTSIAFSALGPITFDSHSEIVAGIPEGATSVAWCYGAVVKPAASAADEAFVGDEAAAAVPPANIVMTGSNVAATFAGGAEMATSVAAPTAKVSRRVAVTELGLDLKDSISSMLVSGGFLYFSGGPRDGANGSPFSA
jgi:hypothetical protein